MLRNQEIARLLFVMAGIGAIAAVIGAFISFASALLIVGTSLLFIGCALWFTRWRYREIEKLSGYLRQISSGDYTLDVRDNTEGELSILKNEIYKVTLKLSEQSTRLTQDKVKLTNAISDISHQLKTPLTSMSVMADLLADPQLPPDKRSEFTGNIRQQLERIEWLVSALLKLSKIDAGTAQFKSEPIHVQRLIDKALEPLRIRLDLKEQAISVTGDDHVTFRGDQNWTTEALINILKNCIEHTPDKGHIQISFAENALFTEILITDSGKGIPKEDLPYIFKRFYKGKNASEESVGIGLAMAHSIITSQSGAIEVKSEEDRGTQFLIKFYKQIV